MRRIAITVVMVAVLSTATSPHARAHSAAGVSPSNYRTVLKSFSPRVDGVTVRVIETGSRFELTNATATTLIVEGYQGEPFLRVDRRGVFENSRSPSTYLSRSCDGGAAPEFADASATPEWKRVSATQTARWHDHRIHWMGGEDPPVVTRAPDRTHVVIPRWEIRMRYGPGTLVATGDLRWVPGPEPTPWLVLAAGFAVIGVTSGLSRRRWWPMAILLAALIAGDAVHAFGVASASAGTFGSQMARAAAGSAFSIVAWAVGLLGVGLLVRRKIDGVFAAAFSGLVIALLGGLVDVSKLSRSQIAFAGSPTLARFCVALSLGLGVGLAIAAALAVRAESRLHA